MGKSNIGSTILVLVVAVLIGAASWLVISYLGSTLSAVVTFASGPDGAKLAASGIHVPPQIEQLRADLPLILPLLYAGFPLLLIIIAILSFIAGSNYHGMGEVEESETTSRRSKSGTSNSPNGEEGDSSEKEEEFTSTKRKTNR